MHVPSTIEAEEAEEIGVEQLLRDIKDLSTGTLSSRVSDQLSGLRGLQSRLAEIRDYLGRVSTGELDVNHQIVYNLQNVFNLLPNLESTEKGEVPPPPPPAPGVDGGAEAPVTVTTAASSSAPRRPFTVATNDQLLVMYLSSLIRAVIALHTLYVFFFFFPTAVISRILTREVVMSSVNNRLENAEANTSLADGAAKKGDEKDKDKEKEKEEDKDKESKDKDGKDKKQEKDGKSAAKKKDEKKKANNDKNDKKKTNNREDGNERGF
jgi:26S proteasome regulatory subunit N8